ncbi:sensor histidine kinase [Cytophagaceae bacterium ABcell3]|nr:sensor histidine kinase [Cytophagaceae bacterium ABcell3]
MLKRYILLTFLVLSALPLWGTADPIVLSDKTLNKEHFFHGNYLDLLEDPSGTLTLEDVMKEEYQHKFFRDTIKIAGKFNFNSYYWGKFTIVNQSSQTKDWLMEFYDFKIDSFEVYIPDADGNFIKKTGGDQYPFSSKEYVHKNFVFNIPHIPEDEPFTIYFKVYIEEPVAVIGVVRTSKRFIQYATIEYFCLALFYGILLSVLFYNLFLFFSVKEKSYFFLATYIFGFGLHAMSKDGTGFQLFWPEYPELNQYATQFFQLVIMASIVLYAKAFLLIRTLLPLFNKWLNTLIAIRIVLFVLSLTIPDNIVYSFTYYYDFFTAFTIFTIGIYTYYYKKYKPARYYMMAFAFFFTGFFITTLHTLRWFELGVYLTAYGFNGGVLLQIFFLSLSVGHRINILIQEKEQVKDQAQKELEEKVNERTMELQEKNRQLDSFVYKASHDIKGPLKSIMGLTSVALKDDPSRSKEYLTHIMKSTKRLDILLHDLLDLTKLQREKPLEITEVHIEDLIKEVILSFKNVEGFSEMKMDIINKAGNTIPMDKNLIYSIIQNFVENSIKYRDPEKAQPMLKIIVKSTKQGIIFTFKDNGLGVPKGYQEAIFDMFTKVNESSNGFGIGLHIVKLSVNKLGGTITMNSTEGKGTEFKVIIPHLTLSQATPETPEKEVA